MEFARFQKNTVFRENGLVVTDDFTPPLLMGILRTPGIGLIVMFRSKNVLDVKSLPDFHRREAPRIIRMVSMRTRVLSTHSTRRIPSCCKFTSLSTYICLIMCSEHTETDFTNPILGKLWLWRILPTALWPSFLRKRGLALSLAL